jgi:hypothetical protein
MFNLAGYISQSVGKIGSTGTPVVCGIGHALIGLPKRLSPRRLQGRVRLWQRLPMEQRRSRRIIYLHKNYGY